MSYENDLFISYAHIDDQPLVEGTPGWVSDFHRVLKIRLSQLLGEEPSVWRDARLRGNDDFAERLDGECPSSAVIVSVVSPRYVKSDWCRRELTTFTTTGEPRLGHRSRVFKVLKTPIEREDEPDVMQPLLGYEFFRRDDASGRCREFPGSSDNDYLARLDDLAHDISETLKLVDRDDGGDAAAKPATGDAGAAAGLCVYLAMTSSDVADQRDQLRRELAGRGYRVLPDQPLPAVGAECREVIRQMLADAVMSIHLIGRYYGSIPEGDQQSMVHMQVEIASERAADADFTQFLWIAADLEPAEERQSDLVAELRSGERNARGTELLSTCVETLKSYAIEALELAASRSDAPAPEEDAEAAPPRAYVVYTPADLETAERVVDTLYEGGLDIMQSVFEGDEAELRELHQMSLQDCDSVLIIYDAAPAVWLETRLRELRKSMGYGREAPLKAKAVYVTGEETAHKRMFRSREAQVIKDFEHKPAATLAPFLTTALGRG